MGVDYELKAYLESKNVHPNLLDEDKVILLRYSINDTANLLEGESEVLYDLLIEANPVAVERYLLNPSHSSNFRYLFRYLIGRYICAILRDKTYLLTGNSIIDKYNEENNIIKPVPDIFSSSSNSVS